MNELTERELTEIEAANSSGLRPVMFVHGLWLLSSSWDRWRAKFDGAGFATLAPSWPDDPDTVEQARRDPEAFADKMVQGVTDHYLDAVGRLAEKPVVIGHSFGGLISQKIAGGGASISTVAIDPAPFRGVLPVPVSSLKSSAPVVHNPANLHRAVSLTFDQFKYGWANNLDEEQARRIYEEFHVPASGAPIFEVVAANLNPFSQTRADTKNPDRGPLLLINGENDHTIPLAPTRAAYKIQAKNPNVTRFVEVPNRGHSLTIDDGWEEVAQIALGFIREMGVADPTLTKVAAERE